MYTKIAPKLSASFPTPYTKDKHNYNTRSAKCNLLDIPLIRHWNNLKRDFWDIPDSEPSLSKIKSYLKKNTMANTELYHRYHHPSIIHRINTSNIIKPSQTQLKSFKSPVNSPLLYIVPFVWYSSGFDLYKVQPFKSSLHVGFTRL